MIKDLVPMLVSTLLGTVVGWERQMGRKPAGLRTHTLVCMGSTMFVLLTEHSITAFGGGCELALACHMRLASENAVLGLPEVSLGIIPGYGGTQRLPRLVGPGRALELILSGRRVKAEEAERIGLVNRVVPLASLREEAEKLAQSILKNGPLAVAAALEAVHRGTQLPLDQGLRFESSLFGVLAASEDMHEGLKAFLEKRPARFQRK